MKKRDQGLVCSIDQDGNVRFTWRDSGSDVGCYTEEIDFRVTVMLENLDGLFQTISENEEGGTSGKLAHAGLELTQFFARETEEMGKVIAKAIGEIKIVKKTFAGDIAGGEILGVEFRPAAWLRQAWREERDDSFFWSRVPKGE